MRVAIATLADKADVSGGKLNIVGATNLFSAPAFPATADLWSVVRFEFDDEEAGAFANVRFELWRADVQKLGGKTIPVGAPSDPGALLHSIDVQWRTGPFNLPAAGLYSVKVIVNDQVMSVIPFHVRELVAASASS